MHTSITTSSHIAIRHSARYQDHRFGTTSSTKIGQRTQASTVISTKTRTDGTSTTPRLSTCAGRSLTRQHSRSFTTHRPHGRNTLEEHRSPIPNWWCLQDKLHPEKHTDDERTRERAVPRDKIRCTNTTDAIDSEYEASRLAWERESSYQEVAVETMLMDDVEEMQRRLGNKFTKKRSLEDRLDARTFSFWKLF